MGTGVADGSWITGVGTAVPEFEGGSGTQGFVGRSRDDNTGSSGDAG
jgi:hypothetical protein